MSTHDVRCLKATCFAKLNLALSVGPVMTNGLHPVFSWMAAIDLGDLLTLAFGQTAEGTQNNKTHLERAVADDAYGPIRIDWPDTSDLVYRAIERLRKEAQAIRTFITAEETLRVRLTKRTPPGTGLGAGSSDAAHALVLGNRLLKTNLDTEALGELAAELGSDVPFFVGVATGQTASFAYGTGTDLSPAPLPNARHAAVIFPPYPCPTALIYQAYDEQPKTLDAQRIRRLTAKNSVKAINESLFNDLTPAAFQVVPELARIQQEAQRCVGQKVHLTGSGAAMFTLFETRGASEARAAKLNEALGLPTYAATLGQTTTQ